jgi:phosphomevalonate kinase
MTTASANPALPVRVTRAPGKLVLLGEYAVLEGAPAWVTAVDRFVEVTTGARGTGASIQVIADSERNLPLRLEGGQWVTDAPGWELATVAVTEAIGSEPSSPPHLTIDSRAFYLSSGPGEGLTKAGFGSSAAVVAAVLGQGMLFDSADRNVLFRRARAIHHRVQGSVGSGIDIAAAIFGGTFSYRLDTDPPRCSRVSLPAGLRLIAVWTGASASTPQLVSRVLEWKVSAPALHAELFGRMAEESAAGIEAARAGDVEGLLEAAHSYGRRMSQLGRAVGIPIVTPMMDELAGRLSGLAAVKPSGAGGGDVVLAFTTEDKADETLAAVSKAGFTTIPLGYGAEGVARI